MWVGVGKRVTIPDTCGISAEPRSAILGGSAYWYRTRRNIPPTERNITMCDVGYCTSERGLLQCTVLPTLLHHAHNYLVLCANHLLHCSAQVSLHRLKRRVAGNSWLVHRRRRTVDIRNICLRFKWFARWGWRLFIFVLQFWAICVPK